MKNNTDYYLQESVTTLQDKPSPFAAECWFDDACILDMDYFVKTLVGIKAKGVRPDLVGSIITHYASKWLPDLSGDVFSDQQKGSLSNFESSPESVTALWMKQRFFVETLVGVLPPEKDSIPCNFLLRLLRTANMVGVEPSYRAELEKRISWQLDQASLKELMIPSFSHTCGTLLDVELIIKLVKMFVNRDDAAAKSGAAMVKVAKLVDNYLAEAAVDANLSLREFVALAGALPSHGRATDDGLYRAIDTYLKAHPGVSKQDRKSLCRLIDSRKLSPEASMHASQNERLPVRAVIQVLFSEQNKLHKHIDWSGSFSGSARSPNPLADVGSVRCHSKRDMSNLHKQIRNLKDEVLRLQSQFNSMQMQIERKSTRDKKKGIFKWNVFGIPSSSKSGNGLLQINENGETPATDMKTRLVRGRATPKKWRNSMS